MVYSQIKEITIQNFMSIEKAVLEFDDTGVIAVKGYNDSGKSAILKAMRVLLEDWAKTKQRKFIKDGKEYFRITVTLTDGVKLIRDKYRNGQSLYEMQKDGNVVYTNKAGRTLTTVKEIPPVIRKYLSVPVYNGRALFAQSCNEPYLLVETKGGDNYKMLGEASDDGTLVKSVAYVKEQMRDNMAHLNESEQTLAQCDAVIESTGICDEEILNSLKEENKQTEQTETKRAKIADIAKLTEQIQKEELLPKVEEIGNIEQLVKLEEIVNLLDQLAEPIPPELPQLEAEQQMTDLMGICKLVSMIENIEALPLLNTIDVSRYDAINDICAILDRLSDDWDYEHKLEIKQKTLENALETLTKECLNLGIRVVECPKCGFVHAIDRHPEGGLV